MTKKNKSKVKNIRVVELFAGVGGFRIGLCGTKKKPLPGYEIVWANQWEPSTKIQHAAMVYKEKFHDGKEPNPFFNEDINKVVEIEKLPVPEHDLLVGGFPCQDYSVARTLSQAAGIEGKKGVLWWSIHKIISRLDKKSPKYLLLENVDRLLKSPAKQRGRDFGIILASLSDLGYAVEWRIINAADYGMPQRRRRIFIMAYKKGTSLYKKIINSDKLKWITVGGTIAKAFPVTLIGGHLPLERKLSENLVEITNNFSFPFENTGIMIDGKFISMKTKPNYSGLKTTLGLILLPLSKVPTEYIIPEKDIKIMKKWKDLKGGKVEKRTSKSGFEYKYSEGPVAFPDKLDRPSRTIVTGEGGSTPSRFKHVVSQGGKLRRLMPIELEKLCMFPPDFTKHESISDNKRAFFMGNALVVGVIERLGKSLLKAHRENQ